MTIERFLANWMTQLRKGVLELVVMRALKNADSYGYALVESIKASCGLEITDGTLYAIFVRLKQEALIEPYWREMEKGPSRKYYRLTDLGQSALAQMELSWAETEMAIDGAKRIGSKT
jgi:PadR family transcriptional regulator PadR